MSFTQTPTLNSHKENIRAGKLLSPVTPLPHRLLPRTHSQSQTKDSVLHIKKRSWSLCTEISKLILIKPRACLTFNKLIFFSRKWFYMPGVSFALLLTQTYVKPTFSFLFSCCDITDRNRVFLTKVRSKRMKSSQCRY